MKIPAWKFVFSLILLILLPIQGFAAAGMLACAPQAPQINTQQVAHHMLHDADAMAQHLHADQGHDQGQDHSAHGKFKCGQGGPCCPVAAITSLTLQVMQPEAITIFVSTNTTPPSALVRMPERPPRFSSV